MVSIIGIILESCVRVLSVDEHMLAINIKRPSDYAWPFYVKINQSSSGAFQLNSR
jgi:hypothetical protein